MKSKVRPSMALIALAAASSTAAEPQDYPIPVPTGDKVTFVTPAGQPTFAQHFEDARRFSDGLAAVMLGGYWGYADARGNLVIHPKFQAAGSFQEGFAPAGRNGLYGFIDLQGNEVIRFTFERAGAFSAGWAPVRAHGDWFFIGRDGQPAFDGTFERAKSFSEGLAAVRVDGRWGYIDTAGEFQIEPGMGREDQFRDAWSFSEGLAAVRAQNGRYGFIDRRGGIAIPARYRRVTSFSEGAAAVMVEAGEQELWVYINSQGKAINNEGFLQARPFVGGVALVRDAAFGRWHLIDRSGRVRYSGERVVGALAGCQPVEIKVDSVPAGAEVWFLPLSVYVLDPTIVEDEERMGKYQVQEGNTDTSTYACQKAFRVIFELDGFVSEWREIEVKAQVPNKVGVVFTDDEDGG